MIHIPVNDLQIDENGHTIWVHSLDGTVLRIKTLGKIVVDQCRTSPMSHGDILVKDDIHICLSGDARGEEDEEEAQT